MSMKKIEDSQLKEDIQKILLNIYSRLSSLEKTEEMFISIEDINWGTVDVSKVSPTEDIDEHLMRRWFTAAKELDARGVISIHTHSTTWAVSVYPLEVRGMLQAIQGNIVSFELTDPDKSQGTLKIRGYKSVSFSGFPADLLDYLCNGEDRGEWKSYADLQSPMSRHDFKAEATRKAIKDINDRVSKATDGRYSTMIENEPEKLDNPKSPLQYRLTI